MLIHAKALFRYVSLISSHEGGLSIFLGYDFCRHPNTIEVNDIWFVVLKESKYYIWKTPGTISGCSGFFTDLTVKSFHWELCDCGPILELYLQLPWNCNTWVAGTSEMLQISLKNDYITLTLIGFQNIFITFIFCRLTIWLSFKPLKLSQKSTLHTFLNSSIYIVR